ncbi:ABC transporter [Streptomyces fructofermentans]|uniref:Transporter n=1 Tax=Streptomyces fructofermentans TaxID=152141 RepID=A0A918NH00_9ACTN|nr:ABC transporter [Streptomyces fructofermentans]GGX69792.1 transporter [Streptomyces fructofermentans]
MSNVTSTPIDMNRTAAPATAPKRSRGPRLTGVVWLTWRQHRAAYWTILAGAAFSVLWMTIQRADLIDFLTIHGWPGELSADWVQGAGTYSAMFNKVGLGLGFIPLVLGVFLGAPLLAGDLESGTAKLVTSQTVSPNKWLAAKLGISTVVVVVCMTAISLVFGWWWAPVKDENNILDWTAGAAFDNTGLVPVALTLFTVVGGVAIGMVLRRTLLAMVVTFVFGVVVQVVWAMNRLNLGQVVTRTTDKGVDGSSFPKVPSGSLQLDQSYVTGAGDTLGTSTCVHAASKEARAVCLEKADIVGWSVDYLPMSQMSGMQWLGSSILLGMTAAVAGFIFIWTRKRLV